jgi:hypothetical protein
MHKIKPGLRRQDLEGIHLPSFRFSWKLKKLCRFDFFVYESWQTAVKSQGKTITSLAVNDRLSKSQIKTSLHRTFLSGSTFLKEITPQTPTGKSAVKSIKNS